MADHRAEQILAAFLTTLTGLTTTSTRVARGRAYPLEKGSSPALSIFMGNDTPPEPGEEGDNYPYIDSTLEIIVRAHVKSAGAVLDTTLNLIRKEVVKALQGTTKLGLSGFVIHFWEGETTEPEIDGEGEKRATAMDTIWLVKYRRSVTDPSA